MFASEPVLEVVDADDVVALREEVLAEMGAEKPGPTGDDSARHEGQDSRRISEQPSDPYELLTAPRISADPGSTPCRTHRKQREQRGPS